jgi:hypothetical protein
MDIIQQILLGSGLTRSQALEKEFSLEQDSDDCQARANLIGYYDRHHYCCEQARVERVKHIIWAIDNLTPFPEIGSFMSVHLIERIAYGQIKQAFHRRISSCPADWVLLAEAAYFEGRHEPEDAEELYRIALSYNPDLDWLQSRFEKFRQNKKMILSNLKSWRRETAEQYFSNLNQCAGGPPDSSNILTNT